MKRHDGGYVLVYVVVVIVILCILVPAACSNSLKNLKAQQSSIERMRQLYAAEGQIERFVAELEAQAETIEETETRYEKVSFDGNIASDIANGWKNDINENLDGFQLNWTPDENNNYKCKISLVSAAGSVTVNADIQVELEIKKDTESEEAPYKITSCTITYSSYDISTAAETEDTGEEGG